MRFFFGRKRGLGPDGLIGRGEGMVVPLGVEVRGIATAEKADGEGFASGSVASMTMTVLNGVVGLGSWRAKSGSGLGGLVGGERAGLAFEVGFQPPGQGSLLDGGVVGGDWAVLAAERVGLWVRML